MWLTNSLSETKILIQQNILKWWTKNVKLQ